MSRKSAKEYPPFSEGRLLSGLIPGESGQSGYKSGFEAETKLAIISANTERILGREFEGILESRSGLKIGDFTLADHGHEGRGRWRGLVNAENSAFQKEDGREKRPPPGPY